MATAILLLLKKRKKRLRSDETLVGFIHKQGYEEKLIERLIQAIDVLNNPKRLRKLPISECYYNKRSVVKKLYF